MRDDIDGPRPERLQKIIARAGLASRRVADDMIRDGRVQIDGRVAQLGDRADPTRSRILVDGVLLPTRPDLVYYLVHKPEGVISTSSDPQGRPTVIGLVPPEPRVFTVGRLDADTTGLILLTNDGDLAELLMHPRHGASKTYVARVDGVVTKHEVRRLLDGVALDDGPARAREARLLGARAGESQLEIVMGEGRNREVRRMCGAIGHPVLALHRIAIGPLKDPSLKPGEFRTLEIEEVRSLYGSAGRPLDGVVSTKTALSPDAAASPQATRSPVAVHAIDAGPTRGRDAEPSATWHHAAMMPTDRVYPAQMPIRTRGPVQATVRPPGSKSVTNRALIVAGLAEGVSHIRRPLHSDDTEAMVGALRGLGVGVKVHEGDFVVSASGRPTVTAPVLDARGSGTTARFVTAMATLATGEVVIDGNARMRERPIADLVDALRELGADVQIEGTQGCPPVRIRGPRLVGGDARIDASRSSQYVSAVMMAAPFADEPVRLQLAGPVVSRPYLVSTADVMGVFGAVAVIDEDEIDVRRGGYTARDFTVEPDASAAAYPWVAAAITEGRVTVEGIDPSTSQADIGLLGVLEQMGCDIEANEAGITVVGPGELEGVEVDMNHCPDAVLAAAVAASFADGATTIHNVANLRIKETDRLAALETELARMGHDVTTGPDWIRIDPGVARAATISTYDDHRMAMAFSLAGLRVPGVVIDDPACVAKTWPDFFESLERW